MEIKTVAEWGFEPNRQHEFDAGADLCASQTVGVYINETEMVPTGVRVEIPEGYVGLLFARSSLCKSGLVMANGVGVIDSGYTGEIMVPLVNTNTNHRMICVRKDQRIAQLVVVKVELPRFVMVDKLGETERGEGGFGSTGKWGELYDEMEAEG